MQAKAFSDDGAPNWRLLGPASNRIHRHVLQAIKDKPFMKSLPLDGLDSLTISIYADGADLDTIRSRRKDNWVKGFTTNPTLMRRAGIRDYEAFCREAIALTGELPISFEVFADDLAEMERQARLVASWGSNVYVKIPVSTTLGEPTVKLTRSLSEDGIHLNVTALMTVDQVEQVAESLQGGADSIVSVFAGRVADTGRDPILLMKQCLERLMIAKNARLLWASPREILNLLQANEIGCDIITMTDDLLSKVPLLGKDLRGYSLETVEMFRRDAIASGFEL